MCCNPTSWWWHGRSALRTRTRFRSFFFKVVVSAALASACHAEGPPAFALSWGSEGTEDGQFNTPIGIAVDRDGFVYVADYLNHRIQKFTASGAFVLKWGSRGAGPGQLYQPFDVALNAQDVLYVSELGNRRVQKFTRNGAFLGSFLSWSGQQPGGLAIDSQGNVFVGSPDGDNISKLSSEGALISRWGTPGTGDGQFGRIYGVTTDFLGDVWITDSLNSCVQRFANDGRFLARWGGPPECVGQDLFGPRGLTVDARQQVLIVDVNHRVLKFTPDGAPIVSWGGFGPGAGQFVYPSGIVTVGSLVYVVDSLNHRVQEFDYRIPVVPLSWGRILERYR